MLDNGPVSVALFVCDLHARRLLSRRIRALLLLQSTLGSNSMVLFVHFVLFSFYFSSRKKFVVSIF